MKKQLVTIFFAIALSACTEKEPLCVESACQYGDCVKDDCVLWQSAFTGTYTGVTTCGSLMTNETIIVQPGMDANALIVDDLNATATSATTFTIPSQAMVVDGIPSTVTGSGFLHTNGQIHITFNLYTNTGQHQGCSFVGG